MTNLLVRMLPGSGTYAIDEDLAPHTLAVKMHPDVFEATYPVAITGPGGQAGLAPICPSANPFSLPRLDRYSANGRGK
jgi:hypothetical protein